MASTFDAESNIPDRNGSVKDYGNYFRFSDTTEEQAYGRGLQARDKGRKGFVIGKYVSDSVRHSDSHDRLQHRKFSD